MVEKYPYKVRVGRYTYRFATKKSAEKFARGCGKKVVKVKKKRPSGLMGIRSLPGF